MIFRETDLRGVWRISLDPRRDERGHFARTFCRREFASHGLAHDFVQCNASYNLRRGTLRGLHLQLAPHAEDKLVRCTRGAVFDVAVDLRPESPQFARWTAVELSASNGEMLFIPRGFAHGYLTLQDDSEVFYQVTAEHHPASEAGVRWDDPEIGIAWPSQPACVSERDRSWPPLQSLRGRLAAAS